MAGRIVSVRVVDHSDEVLRIMTEQAKLGLEAIGAEAATYAQKDCPVDTGLLHNSIAWAVTGKSGGGNDGSAGVGEASKPLADPEIMSVYIGTNVDYAVYVEYGKHHHTTGKNHFLRDAATKHSDRYKKILEAALKG